MKQDYEDILRSMENTVHRLAKRVPAPQRVPFRKSFVYRHVEKTIHQALVQKMARMVSTLHAAHILMEIGFVQEQGALQSILDEIEEDITFLMYGVIFNDISTLHKEYLEAFFEEEFDADTALDSTQKRPMIPRKKIRAYITRMEGVPLDPSTGVEVYRTVSKAYSGYVHAASPHIMDMYGGDPPQFFMRGMLGTERHAEHQDDIWNYFYRGIMAFALAAKAFGDETLFKEIFNFVREFEHTRDENQAPDQ